MFRDRTATLGCRGQAATHREVRRRAGHVSRGTSPGDASTHYLRENVAGAPASLDHGTPARDAEGQGSDARRSSRPVKRCSRPVKRLSRPVEKCSLPVDRLALPVKKRSVPVDRLALPVKKCSRPVDRPALPVKKCSLPVKKPSLPVKKKPKPRFQRGIYDCPHTHPISRHHAPIDSIAAPRDTRPSKKEPGCGGGDRTRAGGEGETRLVGRWVWDLRGLRVSPAADRVGRCKGECDEERSIGASAPGSP